jgi:negative regulator of flagellin synthesis FlgM
MRIDAFNKVSQLYNSNKIKSTVKAREGSYSDKLEISKLGKDYQAARQVIGQAPDVREDLIREIKQKLDNGTYQVSNEAVADKLIERFNDMSL